MIGVSNKNPGSARVIADAPSVQSNTHHAPCSPLPACRNEQMFAQNSASRNFSCDFVGCNSQAPSSWLLHGVSPCPFSAPLTPAALGEVQLVGWNRTVTRLLVWVLGMQGFGGGELVL